MRSKIIKNVKNQVKLSITVPAQKLKEYLEEVLKRFAPQVEIAGFRPGKAPKRMVIEQIGTARINQEIMDMAIRQNIGRAVFFHKLSPVTSPKVNLLRWTFNPLGPSETDVLEYEVEFGILPKVELGDYKKIRIKHQSRSQNLKATDREVDAVIKRLQSQKAKLSNIDRPAKKGDWLEISFTGKYQGVIQEKLVSQKHPIILGSGALIPGFEDQLVGLKKGKSKIFKLKIPLKFRDEKLAGKEVEFEVTVNQLKKVDLPALNDAFAGKFGYKNLTDLKTAVSRSIAKEKADKSQKDLERKVMDQALKITRVEVPDSLIDQEAGKQIELIKQNLARQGMNFEKYLQLVKKTPEELQKEVKPQVRKNIEIGLMLGEVAKREGWDPKDKTSVRRAIDRLIEIATD
jgi:trigger factor